MKYDYIKNKLINLGYNSRDIKILINCKNIDLLRKYFYSQGIREIDLLKILKQEIKKPVSQKPSKNSTYIYGYDDDDDDEENTVRIEISFTHFYSGTVSIYGNSYECMTVSIPRRIYEDYGDRELKNYIRDNFLADTIPDYPDDYEYSHDSVSWDDDSLRTEIDYYQEI